MSTLCNISVVDAEISDDFSLKLTNATVDNQIRISSTSNSGYPDVEIEVSGSNYVGPAYWGSIETDTSTTIYSNDNGTLELQSILSAGESLNDTDISLNITGVNLETCGIGVSCGSNTILEIVDSVINSSHGIYASGEKASVHFTSSKINLNTEYVGMNIDGYDGEIVFKNSEVKITNTVPSSGYPGYGTGALTILSNKMVIDSSTLDVSSSNTPAITLGILNDGDYKSNEYPEITLINSSVVGPSNAQIVKGEYVYSVPIQDREDYKVKYNGTFFANAGSTSPVSHIVIGKSTDVENQSLYSITDIDGKWVAVKENRDGNTLTLTADADNIILTLTPAQARALLKSGVEKLKVKTNSHEYALDMVKIVETLETNEFNVILTTRGSDYELLIGKDAYTEFVTVK